MAAEKLTVFEYAHPPSTSDSDTRINEEPDEYSGRPIHSVACFECSEFSPCCQNCFLQKHRGLESHWVHVWKEDFFFRKTDMAQLDSDWAMNLGHGGELCPKFTSTHPPIQLQVADSNGIHRLPVRLCQCCDIAHNEHWHQFTCCHLFPSSISLPRLIFTWDLLDVFNLSHFGSKMTAYDFIETIRQQTNEFFASTIPVCSLSPPDRRNTTYN
jgi:hypothetical protein